MAKMIGMSSTYLSKVERDEFSPPVEDKVKAIALDSCVDRSTAISTRVRLFRLFLLIPCWESQRLILKRSASPRATKIGVVSQKALDHHRPNREESFIRIRLQSGSTTQRFGPIAERHGPADPEPFALRGCDLVTHALSVVAKSACES
jgi:hypothetical protein